MKCLMKVEYPVYPNQPFRLITPAAIQSSHGIHSSERRAEDKLADSPGGGYSAHPHVPNRVHIIPSPQDCPAQVSSRCAGEDSPYDHLFSDSVDSRPCRDAQSRLSSSQQCTESEETKKIRERLRLKKEQREIRKITGRKTEAETPGDAALGQYEKSVKFAMTFLFAMFSSGLGGYFASRIVFGLSESFALIIAAILMFATIMVETGLYITKSYKSDIITQKAQKVFKDNERRRFDSYYNEMRRNRGRNLDNADAETNDASTHHPNTPTSNIGGFSFLDAQAETSELRERRTEPTTRRTEERPSEVNTANQTLKSKKEK